MRNGAACDGYRDSGRRRYEFQDAAGRCGMMPRAMVTENPGRHRSQSASSSCRDAFFENGCMIAGRQPPSGSTLFVGKTLMRLGIPNKASRRRGPRAYRVRAVHMSPPAPRAVAAFHAAPEKAGTFGCKDTGIRRRPQPRWCMPNSMRLSTVSVLPISEGAE